MASIKKTPNGSFQLTIRSKLLPKTIWATFCSYEEAERYGAQVDALLKQGIVPESLLKAGARPSVSWSVERCVAEYGRANDVPLSDLKILDTVKAQLIGVATSHMNIDWAELWIRQMKRGDNLSPSTVRHRHGALARCLDWVVIKHPDILATNPLRSLKRGFSAYSPEDSKQVLMKGATPKADEPRNRRLDADEEERILGVLAALPDERALFILALETAMRMRECYTLYLEQVSFPKKTVHLDSTKNGDNRQVPLSTTALSMLKAYVTLKGRDIEARDGRLFPFWAGDVSTRALDAATAQLSAQFRGLFAKAHVDGFRFHDLRHEATCRLYEKTTLSDILISRITGHRNLQMLKRYASLRGSDLAARLW
jgi:integrase